MIPMREVNILRKIVLIIIPLLCLVIGCSSSNEEGELDLNLNNYDNYLMISSNFESNDSRRFHGNISIRSIENFELKNVMIIVRFEMGDFSEEITRRFEKLYEYTHRLEFILEDFDLFTMQPRTTVLEVSGVVTSSSNPQTDGGIGAGLIMWVILLIIVILILIAFIGRGIHFIKKVDSLEIGTSYIEVVALIGSPKTNKIANEIRTCMWVKHIIRGLAVTRVITFKDDKVISITKHTKYYWFRW